MLERPHFYVVLKSLDLYAKLEWLCLLSKALVALLVCKHFSVHEEGLCVTPSSYFPKPLFGVVCQISLLAHLGLPLGLTTPASFSGV